VAEEVCRAANSITEEGIEEGKLKSPANRHSSSQVLTGIGETAPASIDNRSRRPSRKNSGEFLHL
jgi:hypothetical protein